MAKSRLEAGPALRIVSLAPSATSILWALGALRQIVGVSKWCADVAPVGKLPKLGDCWSLDAERVFALKPALVIGSIPYRQETIAKLLEKPLTFVAMNPRALADVEVDIHLLGRIVGRESMARRLVAHMRRDFTAIKKRATLHTRWPRVYCEAWPNPRISSPPWVAELVDIAGGEMIVPGGKRVSEEEVAEARPDVIVLAWAATGENADPRKAYAVSAWTNVPAILNSRVYVVRDELLNTPGPPLVAGAHALYQVFHHAPHDGAERAAR
ncbi:MAG TPA: ABC transporter substrate-binding protein [Candidatus Dormibacteraeota bacterium]|nr:ABC transporter substrate-binding protein [Candidatus Dormibacteraeota bacterium]